jgi:hypothetical protein
MFLNGDADAVRDDDGIAPLSVSEGGEALFAGGEDAISDECNRQSPLTARFDGSAGVTAPLDPKDEVALAGPIRNLVTKQEQSPLHHWMEHGPNVEILDYSASEDSLFLVWDDSVPDTTAPEVSVVPDFVNPDIVHIFIEGFAIAEVNGDPDLSARDVAVLPLSAALLIGLTPA